MAQVKIKRVYDPAAPLDGFRVLVDRLWPRGMKKDDLHFDLWAKEIAPSPHLRLWYHADTEGRWKEFSKRYIQELEDSAFVSDFLRKVGGQKTITLLYASKNPTENHALILQIYLQKVLD